MKIRQSAEDYLETMLVLQNDLGYIRSIDIARSLEVTKPSVSYATKKLREQGLITMGDDGLICLTSEGLDIAKNVYERHRVIKGALKLIGVSDEIAAEDACRIEHVISEETVDALRDFVEKTKDLG